MKDKLELYNKLKTDIKQATSLEQLETLLVKYARDRRTKYITCKSCLKEEKRQKGDLK